MQVIGWTAAKELGLKRYFTGKPCSKGHIAERGVAGSQCLECLKIRNREWKSKNKAACVVHATRSNKKRAAAVKIYKAAWRLKHHARLLKEQAEYRKLKGDAIAAGKKDWYRRNHAKSTAQMTKYRAENAALIAKRRAERKAKNPEQFRAWDRKKLAKRRGAPGKHTAEDIADIRKLQKGRCAYCKVKLGEFYHVDHITALSRGGTNDRQNLQILCQPCNQAKHALDPIRFAQKRGMLL